MTAYSARPTSTNELTQLVNLTAHGFSVGQVLIYFYNAGMPQWQLAKADTLAHCAGSCIVSIVPSADTFYVTQTGYVNNLMGPYTIGQQYYLSPTSAGNLTLVEPSAAGNVVLPCFVADTLTSGYFTGGSGVLIASANELATVIITAATVVMTADTRYVVEANVPCDLTLPVAANLGQIIIIDNNSTDEVLIGQNNAPMQLIRFGNGTSTPGTAGGLLSITKGDSITLVCVSTNNTLWMAEANEGSSWEVI